MRPESSSTVRATNVPAVRTGASFTGVTETVALETVLRLLTDWPSFTWKPTVRGKAEGFSLELA